MTGTETLWTTISQQAFRVLICLLPASTSSYCQSNHTPFWHRPLLCDRKAACLNAENPLKFSRFLGRVNQRKANKPPKTLTAIQMWLLGATSQEIHYLVAKFSLAINSPPFKRDELPDSAVFWPTYSDSGLQLRFVLNFRENTVGQIHNQPPSTRHKVGSWLPNFSVVL